MNHPKTTKPGRVSFSLPALSIRQQLPLLICLLLVVLIALFGTISYLGVRRASMAIGEQRLRSLTEQLSSLFEQSGHSLAAGTHALAKQEDIVNYFTGDKPTELSSGRAREALTKMLADSQTVRADLRDLEGRLLLEAGRGTAPGNGHGLGSSAETERRWVEPDVAREFGNGARDSNFVGRLYFSGDSMFYPIVARVSRGDQPQGYLLRWRPVRATQKSIAQLSQLLGAKATLYFGNADGSLWTDLLKRVDNHSPAAHDLRKTVHYTSQNGKVIAYSMPIPGTRWVIMVELSEDLILEAANRFLYWMIGIGVVLVITGSLVAWLISRNVTRRLDRLMRATTVIADGDYSSRVPVDRQDEIGKLAVSFNAMITQVRHTQEDLEEKVQRRTQELEAVNKELEAFSYSVSHDLRAPLRAVSGYTMMLKEDYEHSFDDEARRITGNILSNVKMMGRLIDDLIEFSRLGKRDVRKQVTDMKDLAEVCVAELAPAWPEGKFQIDIGTLPSCMGDGDLLKQVWLNLISNAMKYSSRQEEACIAIGAMEHAAGTAYFVRDNGAGFDMRYADKLFKVFQRLHSQEEFEGTGVGLALVKRIVDKHRGEIWSESSPGNGAVFYFRIPA
ncbi:sensor histidine kinase [Puia sp.]|uniref:sensor histidine kinase n=1 Tax=Puia sp. TaxID=2045100 RepID=UPI002F41B468